MDSKKLTSSMFVKAFDFDPDSADPVDVAWVAARDFRNFLFQFIRTVGTGAIDALKVLGNTAANGSGTDVVVKTVTLAAQPDAAFDQVFCEVTAEEIAQAGAAAGVSIKGVSLQIEFATATDEGIVNYIFGGARFEKSGLTADIVA